jgi:hypothetical protein
MPAIPVQDMIANIQDLVDDEEANTHSPAELLSYINSAVGYYDGILATHAEKKLMQYRDVSHDGDELEAVMPYLPRIVSVERTSDSPRTETFPLDGGFASRFPFLQIGGGSIPGEYYIQNNQIAVIPQQASGITNRVWVVLRSPELHYGTLTSGATTTSLVFGATPTLGNLHKVDDAYNMIPFMLTATREVGVMNDFTGSSLTSTLLFTLENNPASAAYSTLPVIDPEYHWLFIYQAIILSRMRTDENKVDSVSERSRLEQLLFSNIRKTQSQKGRYARRYGWA